MGWLRHRWLLFLLLAENLVLLTAWSIDKWQASGIAPAERGKQIAERLGCFNCLGSA